jgi:histidine ammonia-lyase
MFELVPGQLEIKDICDLLNSKQEIRLIESAYVNVERSYQIVQDVIREDKSVYGINTGFGLLASQKIEKEELKDL